MRGRLRPDADQAASGFVLVRLTGSGSAQEARLFRNEFEPGCVSRHRAPYAVHERRRQLRKPALQSGGPGASHLRLRDVWECTSCDFENSPLRDPPAMIQACGSVLDRVPCTTEWAVCGVAPGGEVCACRVDAEGALVWDCDDPPASWNL